MSERSGILRSPFVRLTLYYVLLALFIWGLTLLFPIVKDAFSGERLSQLAQRSEFTVGARPARPRPARCEARPTRCSSRSSR